MSGRRRSVCNRERLNSYFPPTASLSLLAGTIRNAAKKKRDRITSGRPDRYRRRCKTLISRCSGGNVSTWGTVRLLVGVGFDSDNSAPVFEKPKSRRRPRKRSAFKYRSSYVVREIRIGKLKRSSRKCFVFFHFC